MGSRLISSTGRSANFPVETCLHPPHMIQARANGKSKWWTCKSCGARWNRMDLVQGNPTGVDIVGFGKHQQLRTIETPRIPGGNPTARAATTSAAKLSRSITTIDPKALQETQIAVQHLHWRQNGRTLVTQEKTWTVVLGLFTAQGGMGLTKATCTEEGKQVLKCVHGLARGLHAKYTSVAINVIPVGSELMAHIDKKNYGNGMNFVLQWGQYTGGELWEGKEKLKMKDCWIQVNPHVVHGVSKVQSGVRFSIVLFSPGRLEQVTESLWDMISACGFPRYPSAWCVHDSTRHQVWHEVHDESLWLCCHECQRDELETLVEAWNLGYVRATHIGEDVTKFALIAWADDLMTSEMDQLKVVPKSVRHALGKLSLTDKQASVPTDTHEEVLSEGDLAEVSRIYACEMSMPEVLVERDADDMGDVEGLYPPEYDDALEEEEMEEGSGSFEPTAAQKQALTHLHDNPWSPTHC
eukprot:5094884-Amphidinium_carterae.1